MFPSNFVEYLDEENDLQNSGELWPFAKGNALLCGWKFEVNA